jgi:hypothetical protein
MVLVKKRCVFGAKTETTSGTKQTLAVGDAAFNVYDLEIVPDIKFDERPAQGSFGTQKSVPGGRKGKATFKIDCGFDGLVIPGWANTLLPACGLVKTGSVFAPKTQTPDTAGATVKTLTIGKWMDGKFISIYGAMGTVKWGLPTGEVSVLEFEFAGVFDGEIDQVMVAPIYPVEPKLRAAGGPVSFDGVTLCMKSMSLDIGNKLYVKECSNTVQGYDLCVVSDRMAKVTGDPESKLVAQQPRMAQYLAGTEGVLRYVIPAPGYVSGTGAKSIEIFANQSQIIENKEGDREGIAVDNLTWQLNQSLSSPDSDFTITFNI